MLIKAPYPVLCPLEPSKGWGWWAPAEEMRLRNGLARLHVLSCEIARCCSDRPPSGYHHTLEKQRLGRAVSCVLSLQSLDLGWWQGLVEGLRPFSPGLARLLARQPRGLGQSPWCRFVSSSSREGRWPVLTRSCTYVHTHTFDASAMWGGGLHCLSPRSPPLFLPAV